MTRLQTVKDGLDLESHPYPWVFLTATGLDAEAVIEIVRTFGVGNKAGGGGAYRDQPLLPART
jgi:hypothetical protein